MASDRGAASSAELHDVKRPQPSIYSTPLNPPLGDVKTVPLGVALRTAARFRTHFMAISACFARRLQAGLQYSAVASRKMDEARPALHADIGAVARLVHDEQGDGLTSTSPNRERIA
jgi:hypothetical protein